MLGDTAIERGKWTRKRKEKKEKKRKEKGCKRARG
jgi:hypothetical protein